MNYYSLMNKNENFKDFIRQAYPDLDVNTIVDIFQYWLAKEDSHDYKSLDLDYYECAEGQADEVREELTKEIDRLEAKIEAIEQKE